MHHLSSKPGFLSLPQPTLALALAWLQVLAKLCVKVGWVIFEERDRAALRIQTMLRRVRGLQACGWKPTNCAPIP